MSINTQFIKEVRLPLLKQSSGNMVPMQFQVGPGNEVGYFIYVYFWGVGFTILYTYLNEKIISYKDLLKNLRKI